MTDGSGVEMQNTKEKVMCRFKRLIFCLILGCLTVMPIHVVSSLYAADKPEIFVQMVYASNIALFKFLVE